MALEPYIEKMKKSSFLAGGNVTYLEEMYEIYLRDPNALEADWRNYFASLPKVNGQIEVSPQSVRQNFLQLAQSPRSAVAAQGTVASPLYYKIGQWLDAYRRYGHTAADLDPLGLVDHPAHPSLDPKQYGLSSADLNTAINPHDFGVNHLGDSAPLQAVGKKLASIYCGHTTLEYMHISDPAVLSRLQTRFEDDDPQRTLNADEKKKIFEKLVAAEGLEKYLGNKSVGQKRFSLEGSDSFIPLMSTLVERAGNEGVKGIIIGMAHRGRLNVLVNILGKPTQKLFDEFAGIHLQNGRSGDVKYHMGYSTDVKTKQGLMHLALAFNPSHLEIISPVVEGSVRARQDNLNDKTRNSTIPIVVHGDAAFIGQGVVMETFTLSQTRGYSTGGTVHIVLNNQVGFTTSDPRDARSSRYCTDAAKMIEAPIIHVNGDDPEAVVKAAQLALDFIMQFNRDVVIDLVSYRRLGHNEADEPAITQPVMYSVIRKRPTVLGLYGDTLEQQGVITAAERAQSIDAYRTLLDAGKSVVTVVDDNPVHFKNIDWTPYLNTEWDATYNNTIDSKKLHALAEKLLTLPKDFSLQPQVAREMQARQQMLEGKEPFMWGFAENLAYASLLDEGFGVRISGQDCGRGTFAHRHAVLHDYETGQEYLPLAQCQQQNAHVAVIDSILSEAAVMAFEYGYASTDPKTLVIWEAQFGDFVNGAQVVIDQFISAAEQKWSRLSGLALFLPHGYEGMGPEHTSARLERFLQLCAEHNMQVCVPTTPAQCFHMIRRQMLRPYRKPLIVMTPKSLLRHKLAVSTWDDLVKGAFQPVIGEVDDLPAKKIKRVVLCAGRVYYDLLQKRRDDAQKDVAIIRIEQLYPFPEAQLKEVLAPYKDVKDIVWCQEEPQNQGAWYSLQHAMRKALISGQELQYAGRVPSAAPAAGYLARHTAEQQQLVKDALTLK